MLPARTTSLAVAKIIEVDSDIDLEAFIDAANEMVTEVCAPLGYTAYRLEMIERWLAAHFYETRDQRSQDQRASSLGETVQTKIDLGLDNSRYGQNAKRLDTKGGLALLENAQKTIAGVLGNVKPGVVWLGTTPTNVRDNIL